MPLSILNVAYPLAPVSRDAVGGAEQVVAALDQFLIAQGHRSLVVACDGSQIIGRLLPVPRVAGHINLQTRRAVAGSVKAQLDQALAYQRIDVVHLHGVDFVDYLPVPGVPVLVTLHLPVSHYPPQSFAVHRPRTFFVAVSQDQQNRLPRQIPILPAISNGVDVEMLRPLYKDGRVGGAVVLGRICPEKGFHLAVQAARRAGWPLAIAGQVFPYPDHEGYFKDVLWPLLDEKIRFIGPLGFGAKRQLMSAAGTVLIPSQVPETSSLVAMESLACGTPVVAMRVGALPEIIEHGVTGFLVDDVDAMAAAMKGVAGIDRSVCRQQAKRRFSHTTTLAAYLRTYRALAGR